MQKLRLLRAAVECRDAPEAALGKCEELARRMDGGSGSGSAVEGWRAERVESKDSAARGAENRRRLRRQRPEKNAGPSASAGAEDEAGAASGREAAEGKTWRRRRKYGDAAGLGREASGPAGWRRG